MTCAVGKRKASIEALLYKERATFYRFATPDETDRGQASPLPDVVVLAGVKCRIGSSRQTANEGDNGNQIRSKVRVSLFMSPDVARPDDAEYVIITTQNDRRLEVSGSNPTTDMLELRIDCLEDR
jgi:hypothetical protein